jgi:hypothetical protein
MPVQLSMTPLNQRGPVQAVLPKKPTMKLSCLSKQIPALAAAAILVGCVTQPASTTTSSPAAAKPVSTAALPPVANAPAVEDVKPVLDLPPLKLSNEAAEFVARFTAPSGGDAQPHELSDTTSFPEAMKSLQEGAKAPKFEYVETSRAQAPAEGLTADGNSTQLVVRDWTGLVLVPISTSLSVAHTTAVRLTKVEAHPLKDGRVRVWVRVQNIGKQDFSSEVACSFRMHADGAGSSPYFYELDVPARGFRDVFFVSPDGKLSTYTVLVRPTR